MRLKYLLSLAAALPTVLCAAGNIVRITEDFGPNPNGVMFYIYVPAKLQANPPIVVNPHWCTGTAQAVFTGTDLATQADTYGYIMIFPEAPRSGKCWDLSSPETLKHDAGGDSLGIASMVRWTLKKYNANPKRVFSMGTSSGAMMTNVLLGAYPDLFAAGSAWAGVPFGCYSDVGGTAQWSSRCATGQIRHTGAEWKAIVEAAYPGYTGWRPKMQSVHGTNDETVNYQNLEEQVKQWTAVLGQSTTPVQTLSNTPNPNWTTYIYGDKFQAVSAAGVTHNIQTNTNIIMNFFDLRCTASSGCFGRPDSDSGTTTTATSRPITTSTTSSTSTSTSTTIRTTTSTSAWPTGTGVNPPPQTKWGQCAGLGYTGPTACVAGTECKFSNDWYSQCL